MMCLRVSIVAALLSLQAVLSLAARAGDLTGPEGHGPKSRRTPMNSKSILTVRALFVEWRINRLGWESERRAWHMAPLPFAGKPSSARNV